MQWSESVINKDALNSNIWSLIYLGIEACVNHQHTGFPRSRYACVMLVNFLTRESMSQQLRLRMRNKILRSANTKYHYYSMKFPRFWLVKTSRIIHHNQLLLTKFGKNVVILNRRRQNDVKGTAFLQVIEPLTVKTWGRGWVVLVVRTKWRNCRGTVYSFHGEILSKNIARTEEDNSTDNICYEYISQVV